MLTGILVFFHVIACLTLILVILLQVGRGHGLSGASFGQGGVQTVFGTKTVDFLTKATSVMAVVFVITCLSLDIVTARKSKSLFAPAAQAGKKIDLEELKKVIEKLKAEEAAKAGKTETAVPENAATAETSATPAEGSKEAAATQKSPFEDIQKVLGVMNPDASKPTGNTAPAQTEGEQTAPAPQAAEGLSKT
ncbi:MAG TPA: preprotein translocase subunit SecG [Candidatus Omnitrophota bacterium]|nr:preprotein translocase subunit SecG [Candidatus Omnitrophota bacterium]